MTPQLDKKPQGQEIIGGMRADGGKVWVDTQVRFLAWGNCWAVVSLQDRIDLQRKELIREA